jgi:hypothetical protein
VSFWIAKIQTVPLETIRERQKTVIEKLSFDFPKDMLGVE